MRRATCVTDSRPGRYQTIEAKAHCENDPATPKPRLSDRAAESTTTQSSTGEVFFVRVRQHSDRSYGMSCIVSTGIQRNIHISACVNFPQPQTLTPSGCQ